MKYDLLKIATKLTENTNSKFPATLTLRILQYGKCINISEKKPNKYWNYTKMVLLHEKKIYYIIEYNNIDGSTSDITVSEAEFALCYINLSELRRKKLERLNSINR